ncbi:MAG: NHLP family bacteriocin export ABC transporter peptidase/permease/ATPase subunit [Lachnospiraceae bacterium]|nr:NHLP family bacteriocin export ABC transporter peptidase/permease/ATPase subunit [Lachnospiraceae bacterium]
MNNKSNKKPVKTGVVKVPVVMQMEALECGAASLAMVLAYYGKWVPLEQMRLDCGVSRDGSNARNILKAARAHGLESAGYRYEVDELKQYATFPCIIHWNFNHFVVLCGFKNNKALINDPAYGNVEVSMKIFDESFTGIAIQFEPTESFEPSGKKKNVMGFALERLSGTGSSFVFMVISTMIVAAFNVINPAFSRIFIDQLLTGQKPEWFMPFIAGISFFAVLQFVASWIQAVVSLRISGKMDAVGNSTYMWKVLRLPMEFFSQRMAGDIQQRQMQNATITQTVVGTIAPLCINFIMMFVYLFVMIKYSPILTLIGMFSIIINLWITNIISNKRINVTRVQQRDEGKLYSATVSGIEMIETIKAAGAENGFFSRWAGFQASVNKQVVSFQLVDNLLGMVPQMVNAVTNIVITILGMFFVMNGHFTLGMILAFQGFYMALMEPVTTLIGASETIQEMRTDMERIEDVLKYPVDVDEDDGTVNEDEEYSKLSGNVELKHITFGYSRLSNPVIKDFSMSLKQGSRVAFVGASGCGKSTLSKLISGLYQPWEGEITFDGKHIGEIDRSIFRGSLAVVDQDITLFEDTISNNIKMWDSSIEDFEMIMAANDANIHEDIIKREGGYNHRLIEGGRNLSGGQRQRIEIARVLAQDPTIIILDEATSALDAKTEYEVIKAITDRGITCIVVAHRLSTIRDCDEIIVLDHGDVAERGTHDELYAKGGLYTQLVSSE